MCDYTYVCTHTWKKYIIVHIYSSRCELIMIDNEGLGFHIKGSAPVIIYATDPGSPAARAGVVPGSCIVEVSVYEYVCMYTCIVFVNWPCGPMDKASDYGSGDSRFKSWQGQYFCFTAFLITCTYSR